MLLRRASPSGPLLENSATEWVVHFPEIKALLGTPQDPEWHPEGDVFTHACNCCDAVVQLPEWRQADPESRAVYLLAVLAHDFAKPSTTQEVIKSGNLRIVSPGHEEAGGPLTEAFLNRIHAPNAVRERVVPLVINHLAHLQTMTDRSVRRLAKRLEPETIQGLCLVMTADHMGRPPLPPVAPEGVHKLVAKASELHLQSQAPKPILLGRHLIRLGFEPGKHFGEILHSAFEAQLEGEFGNLEQAFQWLKNQKPCGVNPPTR